MEIKTYLLSITSCLPLYLLSTAVIQNSQAAKKCEALKKAMVKKDVKSKVVAKKWLWW